MKLLSSRQRVGGLQKVPQFVGHDVGVNLCRRNVGVSEKQLNNPEVRPARQQMGRECVTERVRGHAVGADAGLYGQRLEKLAKASTGDPTSCASRGKDIAVSCFSLSAPGKKAFPDCEISPQGLKGLATQGGEALLIPLASNEEGGGASGGKGGQGQVAAL